MATARKTPAVDPLVAELPEVEEPKPTKGTDVKFEIEISPYVVQGETFFRWTIIDHNAKPFIGEYSGQSEASYKSAETAEIGAALYVDRIRHTVELKLNAPDSYRITL
jgi:hypothetical protein